MRTILRISGLILCNFLCSLTTDAQIIHVNQAVVGGTGDGSSWTNAFSNLQDALSNTTVSTTEIWVAQGTYYPDEGVGQTNDNRFAAFVMQNDLGIYGGFDGTEIIRSERDFVNNITILSGDIDQNDNSGGDNLGNSYTIVENNGNGLNGTAIIDGFTLTAANSNNGAFGTTRNGGGMYNAGTSPTVSNCIFDGNEANNGGGIFITNSFMNITNCTFINNLGRVDGGGIFCNAVSTIDKCLFRNNTGTNGGGGIFNFTNAAPSITNCVFDKNKSNLGGGIRNLSSSPNIINCTISQNNLDGSFSGIANTSGATPTIRNCVVWNNGIFNDAGSIPTVSNSIVLGGAAGVGNKEIDPLFVDAANGDLRLQACSPAIDMGDNSANSTSEDFDGNTRVFNTTIDMGAYEFQGTSSNLMLASSVQSVTLPQTINTTYIADCDNLIATIVKSGASQISGDVTASIFIDGSVQQFNGIPYVQRHYEINPTSNAATATGTITLYFTQAEFDAFNADGASILDLPASAGDATGKANLRITKFNGASAGNTGNPADYDSGNTLIDPDDADIVWNATDMRWEVTFETLGFSGFFVQTENVPLPVDLMAFTAEKSGAKSLLRWSTASEQENLGFEIQRIQKLETNAWQSISFVKGAGTTLHQMDYKFYDQQPVEGENYYRLKQMDVNGSFSYSDVKVVNFGKADAFQVSMAPNPTEGLLQLTLPPRHHFENISIYNSTGQLVLQLAIQTQISLADLADGWYWLRLESEKGEQLLEQVLKQ
ncbi:MAG: choice-of-anchor Q domain-containing protein [Bacteroidota bacterium]